MTWWQYLILANVYLILFYGFYALLLRRETFFQLNRFYLVGSAILSFMLPLVQAEWARNLFITQQLKQTIYHLDPVVIYQIPAAPSQHLTVGQVLAIVYVGGIILLASRFILQLMVLRYNIKYNESEDAYSFFKTIKLGETVNSRNVIMAHEEVHARQWHSADVMLIEAIMIINWFNPAVYFYRKAIKHIHEFIADRNALKAGTSKQEYALLLLSETFKTPAHELVNPFFNHSLLKQRILMLQKNNSQRTALLKYGLSAPLFALMLILSSATTRTNLAITIISDKAEQIMMVPAAPPALQNVYTTVTSTATHGKLATGLSVIPEVKDFKPEARPVPSKGIKIDTVKDTRLLTVTASPASFKGGLPEFSKYLGQNIRYPAEWREKHHEARVVVSFFVEKDGSLSDIKPLTELNTIGAQEAVRVISASPKWNPGVQDGATIRSRMIIPISFKLEDDKIAQHTADTMVTRKHDNQMIYVQSNPLQYNSSPSTVFSTVTYTRRQGDTTSKAVYKIQTNSIKVTSSPPLYYLDDKEITLAEMKGVKAENIERINVFKDGDPNIYGERGVNGVILITTKKH
ncbi:M56 family metallopeptidase [Mucilaginibacter jinjuensis]|uniref:M56 family metallopeptidase n=1 Tax=Mucilaginibacter jinjuensis TaxID=1176721 RepID=A0ABY7T889_9SPHI|nr:M56 family metallopeptidase [Mucilaginibacter jinjuensis]WCT12690.1 M56 family metallopeptidase [Mucilaginibacter jinjuensis]